MPSLSRRHFLQAASATLAALGYAQIDWLRQSRRYGQALATPTGRKLALLVGINAYPETGLLAPLRGCVNDVEMQYHLLVHRFGFNPADILKLTDAQATRTGILTAFEEHLIQQAKPGDVVVFHFSGHGSRVLDPDRDFPDGLNSTLVPVDSPLPEGFPRQGGPVHDITGHTLFLLMKALQTDQVTVVLDSCHSGGGTRGNLTVRSRRGGPTLQMSEAERAYQQQWLARLDLTPAAFIQQRRAGIARGVAIAATQRDQYAADAPFEDFYAGAFTYAMTQYLWQQTGRTFVNSTVPNVARTTTQISFSGQEPQFEVQPNSDYGSEPIYFTTKGTPPAEAVITEIQGDQAQFWLGGVDSRSLAAFEREAVLTAVDTTGQSRGQIQMTSRQGLIGRGRLLQASLPMGTLLQEQVRGVPTDVHLRIGLDDSLGGDRAAAQAALSRLPRIDPVPLQQGEVHYLLGRVTPEMRSRLGEHGPTENSVGLFYPGLDPLPDAFGAADEAVPEAVQRLQSKLRSLLAARLVKLILNPHSSRLNLSVTMTPTSGSQLAASAFTARGGAVPPPPEHPSIPRIPLETAIQFQIQNHEDRDLYLSVLVIDAAGEMAVLFPNQWTAAVAATRLRAGATLQLPDPSRDSFRLVTQPPVGTTEVLVVASSQPLDSALRALQRIATRSGATAGQPLGVPDPSEVVASLLQDVAGGSRSGDRADLQTVEADQLAALSLTFDVIS